MIALLILGAILIIYFFISKVEVIAIIFFTLTIADINLDIPGLPIKLRAALGILLFARILFEPVKKDFPSFFGIKSNILLLLFIFFLFMLSWGKGSLNFETTKTLLLTLISAYCAYFFYTRDKDYRIIKYSIIISALICFSDMLYTYTFIGSFPIVRIIDSYLYDGANISEDQLEINHNFFGCICGIAYSVLLNDYLTKKHNLKFEVLLLPVFFLGVLMSTSRSSLLGLIAINIVLIINSLKDKENAKRSYGVLSMALAMIALVFAGFIAVQGFLNLESKFLESITYRLVEEPFAVLKKNLGYSYNVHDLDALDWRGESAKIAYNVFIGLPSIDKITGVGYGSYLQNDLGRNGLNPHNGILLLLIEGGMISMIIYMYLVGGEMWKSIKIYKFSSLLISVVFMIFYSLGQNEELTSATMFLFITSMACDNIKDNYKR